MLISFALVALVPVLPALAGQFPVIDGIVGGTSAPRSAAFRVDDALVQAQTNTNVTPGALRVTENSGVCETTPGVYQASGYGDIAANKSIWFWFFEARHDPENAPLTLWLNGGPGSSSMIGLFQEHGPCRITNDSTSVSYNPESWNNVSNILYVDQPVGVGFSYGTTEVGTSEEAAADIYTFLQIFFADTRFAKYAQHEFALWTESYGGHYGPVFAAHFLRQNAAIASGQLDATPINLKYLGVGDGLTDPLNQYPGYLSYAQYNPYYPLVNMTVIAQANASWTQAGGCRAQIAACYAGGNDTVCAGAQQFCNDEILSPLAGNWDVYYVLTANPDPYPPDLTPYLTNASVVAAIGAEATWTETSYDVYFNFADTGDWMRNSAPDLEFVIDSGVRTVVFDGDADYILNFYGVENMVAHLQTRFSAEFDGLEFTNWTVAGQPAGLYKNAGTFSYVRIYGAGHEVSAYEHGTLARGQAALTMFSQAVSDKSISST